MLIRYFAAARAATGVAEQTLDVPAGATVATVAELLAARHPALAPILPRCSYLVDEIAVRDPSARVSGATLDVLPPFAGG
ncbi:MoaD/ThiS family protein [Tsukamurella soli]|uniref:Molybdopterin synthase sulfur carrier subunit n=1 Tax=Tsukamurella soli TaxID=644556 RepID=A0ABP8KGB5_9ACTN